MTVRKTVVRGILIACLATTSARAGSMLSLGVTNGSMDSSLIPTNTTPSYYSNAPLPAGVPSLALGFVSDASPANFVPNVAPPTVSPPVAPNPIPFVPQQNFVTPSYSPSYSAPAPAPTTPTNYDAFINVGTGPYRNSDSLTTGNAQPWYLSSSVNHLFGGVPNIQQRTDFDNAVLQRVQQTFRLSGVPVSLTEDPNAPAAHTLSVVSQTVNPSLTSAIGMTYVGGNGFHYIDNSASVANSVDQLEWIVAHNISHELMLAFNVPENYDQSGKFIDARNATWSMITSPASTFSPSAVSALLAQNFQASGPAALNSSAQVLDSPNVPEPATLVLWGALAGLGIVVRRFRARN